MSPLLQEVGNRDRVILGADLAVAVLVDQELVLAEQPIRAIAGWAEQNMPRITRARNAYDSGAA